MSPIAEIIMQLIAELLKNCPEPEEQKVQFLKAPRFIQKFRLRNKALASGMSLADYKSGLDELQTLQSEMTDADLRDFVCASCKAA